MYIWDYSGVLRMMDLYIWDPGLMCHYLIIAVAASKDEGVEFQFVKTGWRGGYPGVS